MSWGTRATLAAVVIGLVTVVSRPGTALYPRPASDVVDVSSDGRYLVFSSPAPAVIDGDTNGRIRDIYVRDLVTGATELVSRNSAGDQADDQSLAATISDDGRYVAFDSRAGNLAGRPGISGVYHVYLRDRRLGTTVRIDTGSAGNGRGEKPMISGDGRYVAFESAATDLLPVPDTNGKTDVFRWERATGAMVRVSVTGLGTEGDDASFTAAISADGQRVAFVSWATNFGGRPDPVSGLYKNLYVRRIAAHATELVNISIDPRRSS